MKTLIRAIVCRMGAEPVVEEIDEGLSTKQAIVDGFVTALCIGGNPHRGRGIDLWCNDEGMDLELPANRLLRLPGGTLGVLGNFLVCAHDDDESVSLTDDEIAAWLPFLERAPVGLAAHPEAKA